MSYALISRSDDLRRLLNEGFELEVGSGYVRLSHIPYVTASRTVRYGVLACSLVVAGGTTGHPTDHTVRWVGDYPCDPSGHQLTQLVNNPSLHEQVSDDLVATFSFSHKPTGGYPDYYQQLVAYARILEGYAREVDSSVTARPFTVVKLREDESVFRYMDTASSRAGILELSAKLEGERIAIIGLGGTGGYVLDLVSKTAVREIHLFDADSFQEHNAFRSPGAASAEELEAKPTKVAWLSGVYARLRRNVIPHPYNVTEANLSELDSMTFVFLCYDGGSSKRAVVQHILSRTIPFIDVGMGMRLREGVIDGLVRVTACTADRNGHVDDRIPFGSTEDDLYSTNIQTVDLNSLNAALAVIKWKKLRGFYFDQRREHNSVYNVSKNLLTSDEPNDETREDSR